MISNFRYKWSPRGRFTSLYTDKTITMGWLTSLCSLPLNGAFPLGKQVLCCNFRSCSCWHMPVSSSQSYIEWERERERERERAPWVMSCLLSAQSVSNTSRLWLPYYAVPLNMRTINPTKYSGISYQNTSSPPPHQIYQWWPHFNAFDCLPPIFCHFLYFWISTGVLCPFQNNWNCGTFTIS